MYGANFLSSSFCRSSVAADGPGDRFIMGESQAGQQVTSNTPTFPEPTTGCYAVFYFHGCCSSQEQNYPDAVFNPHFNTTTARNTATLNKQQWLMALL